MAYEDLGSFDSAQTKPVILVHGAILADCWGKFKTMLAAKYRVIVIHLPGFGGSQVCPNRVHNTDLFARSLCTLVNNLNLNFAPVIGLSLGTVVIIKAAVKGCVKGKLILVGLPTTTRGFMINLTHYIPIFILRQMIKIDWIREKILMASLRVNVGRHGKEWEWSKKFGQMVSQTSPEAIADVDYVKAVKEIPGLLDQVKNEKVFVYGEYDIQKDRADIWGIKYAQIDKSGHDIFSDQPDKTLSWLLHNNYLK